MAQLVEWLLPTLEIRGLNPDDGKILTTNCSIEKTKIKKKEKRKKKKEAGNCPTFLSRLAQVRVMPFLP